MLSPLLANADSRYALVALYSPPTDYQQQLKWQLRQLLRIQLRRSNSLKTLRVFDMIVLHDSRPNSENLRRQWVDTAHLYSAPDSTVLMIALVCLVFRRKHAREAVV